MDVLGAWTVKARIERPKVKHPEQRLVRRESCEDAEHRAGEDERLGSFVTASKLTDRDKATEAVDEGAVHHLTGRVPRLPPSDGALASTCPMI